MPIGLASYMNWPRIEPAEAKVDSRIRMIKEPGMQDVIKSFAGWLHSFRKP